MTDPIVVLIADDNASDAELIVRELRRSGLRVEPRTAADRAEYLVALETTPTAAVVLLDYAIPGLNGEESLAAALARHPDVPVIFVTGTIGEERAVDLIRAGATDYVLKDRLERLAPVVTRALNEAQERRTRRALQAALERATARTTEILERIPAAFLALDQDQRVTYANRAALTISGYESASSVVGRRLWDLIPGAAGTRFETMTARCLAEQIPVLYEEYLPSLGRWFEVEAFPIREGLAAYVRDISDRRQAEAAIERRNRILAAVSFAAERLLRTTSWEVVINDVLREFGEAAGAGRAFLLQVTEGQFATVRHEWTGGSEPVAPNGQHLPVDGPELAHWTGVLRGGGTLVDSVAGLPEPLQASARALGFGALVAVPIALEGRWTGALVITDANEERSWSDAEVDALRAGARALVAALERERALRHLKAVIEGLPVILWAVGTDQRIELSEGAGLAVLGLQPGAMVGRSIAELFPMPLRAAQTAGWREGQPLTSTVTLGDVVLEVRATPLTDPDGAYTGTVGIATDVTARVKGEVERARLASAVEQTGDAVIITDPENTILYVNSAFERIWQRPRDTVVGQSVDVLDFGGHAPEIDAIVRTHLTHGRPWSGSFTNRRSDGTLFEIASVISPIRDERGEHIGNVEVARDVTREHELEAQLRQSQKMEAIGRLVGGIAHDFNNILTAIDGFAELALIELDGHPARSDVEQIRSGATRAAGLTRQLLAFGRRQILQPAIVDPATVVHEVISMLGRVVGEDIEISTSADADLGRIFVDPSQLEQILMNLVVNARDAMPLGGAIRLSLDNADLSDTEVADTPGLKPGRYVQIAVSDTGTGMTPDVLARAFEPFFTTKPPGEGTGLGLSTVYGIVTQSLGRVSVNSEVGRGTTVTVWFPRVNVDTAIDRPPDDEPSERLDDRHILLVEDDDAVRSFVRRVLEDHGATVTMGSPADALLTVPMWPFDLVLTDVIMPGMTGRDLAERLHARWPALPVLFMSGYPQPADADGERPPGSDGYLPKPFTSAQLVAATASALRPRAQPPPATP